MLIMEMVWRKAMVGLILNNLEAVKMMMVAMMQMVVVVKVIKVTVS